VPRQVFGELSQLVRAQLAILVRIVVKRVLDELFRARWARGTIAPLRTIVAPRTTRGRSTIIGTLSASTTIATRTIAVAPAAPIAGARGRADELVFGELAVFVLIEFQQSLGRVLDFFR
jgi:hypothetical protein